MNLIKKRGKSIVLILIIALALLSIYILKSCPKSFAILDVNNLNSINDPALKIAVEATEECNKLEEKYKDDCYYEIAWGLGYYYGNLICKSLKGELKTDCYSGYGRRIGENYSPDIELIKTGCSKTEFYEDCLFDAATEIGKESSKRIETEQCQKFEQEDIRQRCYEGIGRQLAEDNKELSLCANIKGKEKCMQGFAFVTDKKGNRKEALQTCNKLSGEYAEGCYLRIGANSIWPYNQTIKESFKNCEQYPYKEDCKQGVATGVAVKFFEEKQEKIKH